LCASQKNFKFSTFFCPRPFFFFFGNMYSTTLGSKYSDRIYTEKHPAVLAHPPPPPPPSPENRRRHKIAEAIYDERLSVAELLFIRDGLSDYCTAIDAIVESRCYPRIAVEERDSQNLPVTETRQQLNERASDMNNWMIHSAGDGVYSMRGSRSSRTRFNAAQVVCCAECRASANSDKQQQRVYRLIGTCLYAGHRCVDALRRGHPFKIELEHYGCNDIAKAL
jgi:hypothetical protein